MASADEMRLQWKCRRGLLELDLVLTKYLAKYLPNAPYDEDLVELLELPDNDLWDIVSGRRDDFEARFAGVVARLRAI